MSYVTINTNFFEKKFVCETTFISSSDNEVKEKNKNVYNKMRSTVHSTWQTN